MSIAPINWDARPEKRCLAPCPDGVWCECRERARHMTGGRPTQVIVDDLPEPALGSTGDDIEELP